MPKTVKTSNAAFDVASVVLEIPIAAKPERIWKALTKETTAWWNKDFYTGPNPKGFHIEATLGGRMYEDWGGGNGLVWATVIGVDAPRSLTLAGQLFASFGGPAVTQFQITLKPDGKGTLFHLADRAFGNVSATLQGQLEEGWKLLFDEGLRAYIEEGKKA